MWVEEDEAGEFEWTAPSLWWALSSEFECSECLNFWNCGFFIESADGCETSVGCVATGA